MKIVSLEPIPIEEDDPHGWWDRNRERLRRLRLLGRECGARTYGDDMPALNMERYRLELEARGRAPTALDILSLGGGTCALRSPSVAALSDHGWYLFRQRPIGLVARALEHITPVRLGLAIRAWDPEPLQPASTEAELRSYRERVRQMDARIRLLKAACTDEPGNVIVFGPPLEIEKTPQGLIDEAIRLLVRQRDGFASWVDYRTRLALSTMRAEDAIRRASPLDRLPQLVEHQIADARRRWWGPAASTLRANGWRDAELAEL